MSRQNTRETSLMELAADLGSLEIPVRDLLAIPGILAALAEIDRWYDLELEDLPSSSEPVRQRLAEEIERRRR